MPIHENLISLHFNEEKLRVTSLLAIEVNEELSMHFNVVELAMSVCKLMPMLKTDDDQDQKVVQVLSIRIFNALASSIKLITSGYYQNSALIMRDIMETLFLLDYFRTERQAITRWRHAVTKKEKEEFTPVTIRKALERRDGHDNKNRAMLYKVLSELAVHPNMKSVALLKPRKGADEIYTGAFFDIGSLKEGLEQMAHLAFEIGEIIDAFFPVDWHNRYSQEFLQTREQWIKKFGPRIEASRKRYQQ